MPEDVAVYVSVDTSFEGDQWRTVADLLAKFPDGEGALEELLDDAASEAGLEGGADLRGAGPEWPSPSSPGRWALTASRRSSCSRSPRTRTPGSSSSRTKTQPRAEVRWQVVAQDEDVLDRYREALEDGTLDDSEAFVEAMDDLPEGRSRVCTRTASRSSRRCRVRRRDAAARSERRRRRGRSDRRRASRRGKRRPHRGARALHGRGCLAGVGSLRVRARRGGPRRSRRVPLVQRPRRRVDGVRRHARRCSERLPALRPGAGVDAALRRDRRLRPTRADGDARDRGRGRGGRARDRRGASRARRRAGADRLRRLRRAPRRLELAEGAGRPRGDGPASTRTTASRKPSRRRGCRPRRPASATSTVSPRSSSASRPRRGRARSRSGGSARALLEPLGGAVFWGERSGDAQLLALPGID